ncbi:hypothetical protein A2851_01390 [Candidatus Kaiserbacteria bacterium RIFCSPHIGHO2_01_FULL_53_29]|uniref:EGF-like domain-containing protein n=1 Tax=Candidatus Kaiserbacteria bacterium RIFCSPHIGHO2_01_FULL_53_29 TaxID=1798480 RepID=A0A1F6CXD4_9BACT|nr:MAG: hypothetical protein A2851_01390 [Candidatus Kaiserbacteria bacterium RIFCSPHIGHO2_01_FULL_53_29]
MKSITLLAITSVLLIVPFVASAQQGTIGNPYYFMDVTIPDPFKDLNQSIQQKQILDAMNKQTQALQDANAAARCPANSTYSPKLGSPGYGTCTCNYPYRMNLMSSQCWLPTQQQTPPPAIQPVIRLPDCSYAPGKPPCPGYATQPPISVQQVTNAPSSNEQLCRNYYGQYSTWSERADSQNALICDCLSGYVWNSNKTACVFVQLVLPKTNNQLCQDSYGKHSVWHGTMNAEGGAVCDCATGYKWNDGQAACIAIPKAPVAPVVQPPVDQSPDKDKIIADLIQRTKATSTNTATPKEHGFLSMFGFWPWFFGLLGR